MFKGLGALGGSEALRAAETGGNVITDTSAEASGWKWRPDAASCMEDEAIQSVLVPLSLLRIISQILECQSWRESKQVHLFQCSHLQVKNTTILRKNYNPESFGR